MGTRIIDSPLGPLRLTSDGRALTALDWVNRNGGGADRRPDPGPDLGPDPLLEETARQLDAYFAGRLRDFDLPLNPTGTPFRHRVWDLMLTIPYGEAATYGGMAKALSSAPRAARRRRGLRGQPDSDHHPLSPGAGQRRRARRLFRLWRAGHQGVFADAGTPQRARPIAHSINGTGQPTRAALNPPHPSHHHIKD